MDKDIKAALKAAGQAVANRQTYRCDSFPCCASCECAAEAVVSIVAFLRALPLTRGPTLEECQKARTTTIRPRINYAPDYLADAIELATRES
jgi:hypothetical protein